MSCLTIAACLAGLYLDVGTGIHDNGIESLTVRTREVINERPGIVETESHTFTSENHRALNPYVRVVVGFEQPLFSDRLSIYTEVFHESSIATERDRGVNGARIGFRAYPFRENR